MRVIDQMTALAETGLGAHEDACFWREERYGGLECLAARFISHRYAPHTHDTYVVGAIVDGCETFVLRGVRRYARRHDLCFVHPGEVHDGEPYEESYAYRMSYPAVGLLQDVASQVTGRNEGAVPYFPEPLVYDPEVAAQFIAAHRFLDAPDTLASDERYLTVLAVILFRHSRIGPPMALGCETGRGSATGYEKVFKRRIHGET